LWRIALETHDLDDVVAWPPDLFALVDRPLEASEAYRFVVSPPPGVSVTPPDAAAAVATEWLLWLDGDRSSPPPAVTAAWNVVRDAADVCVEDLSTGRAWQVIEALIALHAIADEACTGLGTAIMAKPGPGCEFRATARELLTETGSLARISPDVLRVLPRCRPSVGGLSLRSLCHHVFVTGPQVDVEWNRILTRPSNVLFPEQHANVLLFPWPLRVRARDFHPVPYTLPHMDPMEVGFFSFEPAEQLDLDLVEGVLRAAIDEAGTVDIVAFPESAITPPDIDPLEALLSRYGVWSLIAGVREPADDALGANWLHIGVRQELVWRHARQHKHHRWRLDGRQIGQYHLGGALSPDMHWWEAVSVPRRSLQIVDEGAVTISALLCEDLARLEPVADRVRAIGPSVVITLLLDGPQLSSRWTARYASVLADDPGTAVCTLTSYGMVRRCRPPGCKPSRVIGLWKDTSGQPIEIELEEGAHAVLISTNVGGGTSVTADGRKHVKPMSTLTLVAVQSIRAEPVSEPRRAPEPEATEAAGAPSLPPLDEHEVSKATSWAEALAEAVFVGPETAERVLARVAPGEWRTRLGLPQPSRMLESALEMLQQELERPITIASLMTGARRLRASQNPAAIVTGTLIDIALGQRLFTEVGAGRASSELLRTMAW
jgi:hypothetical protein